jgi:tRNA(Ile)-lysidine synthase
VSALLRIVRKNVASRRLFKKGQRMLVAVSGGLDSMVLLDVLCRLGAEEKWEIAVAHLNHRMRGRSSDADERLVREVARRQRLPIAVEKADTRAVARAEKISIEMAARKVRHEFLARVARKRGMGVIALAHHADDQVELFFLRLMRGAGSDGIAGMKWRNASPADKKIGLIRPLLDVPKTVLAEYARENRVRFREDATNVSLEIKRNRIRHELLPLIREKYQTAIGTTVARLVEIIGAEADCVMDLAREWLALASSRRREKAERRNDARGSASSRRRLRDFEDFGKLPVAVQRRALHLQLLQQGIAPKYDLIEKLRTEPQRAICLPQIDPEGVGPLTVRRDSWGIVHLGSVVRADFSSEAKTVSLGRRIQLQKRSLSPRPPAPGEGGSAHELTSFVAEASSAPKEQWGSGEQRLLQTTAPIRIEKGRRGEISFGGATIEWFVRKQRDGKLPRFRAGREFFDADKVGETIVLRHWEPGDRFQPIGMANSVKVQDVLVNQKVPQALRHRLIVATTSSGEVFWVETLRISERFKLSAKTKRRLQWRWQRG